MAGMAGALTAGADLPVVLENIGVIKGVSDNIDTLVGAVDASAKEVMANEYLMGACGPAFESAYSQWVKDQTASTLQIKDMNTILQGFHTNLTDHTARGAAALGGRNG